MHRYFPVLILCLLMPASCGTAVKGSHPAAVPSQNAFQAGLLSYYKNQNNGVFPTDTTDAWFKAATDYDNQNDAAWYYRSLIAQRKGHFKEALQYQEKALAIDPENYWYQLHRPQLCLLLGETQTGLRLYEALWKKYPSRADLLYDMINIYAREGNTTRTMTLLDTLERRQGVTEQSVMARTGMLFSQNKQAEAVDILENFVKESPSARIYTLIGDYYMGDNAGLDTALSRYREALSLDAGYTPARFGLAECYRLRNQFDLFFENANMMLADPVMSPVTKTDYLRQLMQAPRFVGTFLPQVDTLFRNLRAAHPCDSAGAYLYVQFLAQSNRMDDAREELAKNLRCHPREYDAWNQILGLDYYLNQYDSLCAYGRQAVALFPMNGDRNRTQLHSIYAIGLWQTKQIDASLAKFREVLAYVSKRDTSMRIQTLSCIGDLEHEKGHIKEAFAAYDKVLKLDPKNLATLNNYAYYLGLRREKLGKALAMSKVTVEEQPTNATYLDTYGYLLYCLGRYAEAKDIFRQCMAYGGSEVPDEIDHYADVLYALGEKEMATVKWRQALALDPSREDIKAKISQQQTVQ